MFNPNVIVKNIVSQPNTDGALALIARLLIAFIFLAAGWGKITGYAATVG
ncbi:MAG: DoxX family protein, partial [Acinetobacter sp.]